jgi:hypothetical protein
LMSNQRRHRQPAQGVCSAWVPADTLHQHSISLPGVSQPGWTARQPMLLNGTHGRCFCNGSGNPGKQTGRDSEHPGCVLQQGCMCSTNCTSRDASKAVLHSCCVNLLRWAQCSITVCRSTETPVILMLG